MRFILILLISLLAACSSVEFKENPTVDTAANKNETSDKTKSELTKKQSGKKQSDSKISVAKAEQSFKEEMTTAVNFLTEAKESAELDGVCNRIQDALTHLDTAKKHLPKLTKKFADDHFIVQANLVKFSAQKAFDWFLPIKKASRKEFGVVAKQYAPVGLKLCDLLINYIQAEGSGNKKLSKLEYQKSKTFLSRFESIKAGFENAENKLKAGEQRLSLLEDKVLPSIQSFEKFLAEGKVSSEKAEAFAKNMNTNLEAIQADLAVLNEIEFKAVEPIKEKMLDYQKMLVNKQAAALKLVNFTTDLQSAEAAFQQMLAARAKSEYIVAMNKALALCNKNKADKSFQQLQAEILKVRGENNVFIEACENLGPKFKALKDEAIAIEGKDLAADVEKLKSLDSKFRELVGQLEAIGSGRGNYADYQAGLLKSYIYHANKNRMLAMMRISEANLTNAKAVFSQSVKKFKTNLEKVGDEIENNDTLKFGKDLVSASKDYLSKAPAEMPKSSAELVQLYKDFASLYQRRSEAINKDIQLQISLASGDERTALEAKAEAVRKTLERAVAEQVEKAEAVEAEEAKWLSSFKEGKNAINAGIAKVEKLVSSYEKALADAEKAKKEAADRLKKLKREQELLKKKLAKTNTNYVGNKVTPVQNNKNVGDDNVVLKDEKPVKPEQTKENKPVTNKNNKPSPYLYIGITFFLILGCILFRYRKALGVLVADIAEKAKKEDEKNEDNTSDDSSDDASVDENPGDDREVEEEKTQVSEETSEIQVDSSEVVDKTEPSENNEVQPADISKMLESIHAEALKKVRAATKAVNGFGRIYVALVDTLDSLANHDLIFLSEQTMDIIEQNEPKSVIKLLNSARNDLNNSGENADESRKILNLFSAPVIVLRELLDINNMTGRVEKVSTDSVSLGNLRFLVSANKEALTQCYTSLKKLPLPSASSETGLGELYVVRRDRLDAINEKLENVNGIIPSETSFESAKSALSNLQKRLKNLESEIKVRAFKTDHMFIGIRKAILKLHKACASQNKQFRTALDKKEKADAKAASDKKDNI